MSAKATIAIADLQSGAKRLNTCEIAENKTNANDQKSSFDSAALTPLEVFHYLINHSFIYPITHSTAYSYCQRSCTINMTVILTKYSVN